jgi:hypothetical protein
MSVVSAKHAHTPTGPFEHGSDRAKEAVSTAPSRDPEAERGNSASHSNRNHTKHLAKHTGHDKSGKVKDGNDDDQGDDDEDGDGGGKVHGKGHGKSPDPVTTQRDIPPAAGDTRVELQNRVEIARQAWDKFNHPTTDRGLLI